MWWQIKKKFFNLKEYDNLITRENLYKNQMRKELAVLVIIKSEFAI